MAELESHAVQVRPKHCAADQCRWDQLIAKHYYLSFRGLFGRGLRHLATCSPIWNALLGWHAKALNVTVRDGWIGWTNTQKLRRLYLNGQNVRFVILGSLRRKNLVSRVLGLRLRRLSTGMLAEHGYRVLIAAIFPESPRFRGTCYRAANWLHLGRTSGVARQPGPTPRWHEQGQPKEVYVYDGQPNPRAVERTRRAARLARPAVDLQKEQTANRRIR